MNSTNRFTFSTHLVLAAVLVQACGLFISPYDATSNQYLVRMKSFHLKFIDDFTSGESKSFNESELKERYDQGDLIFREALEYATKVAGDQLRINAFAILKKEFDDNYATLTGQRALFSVDASKALKELVESNYNAALEGELSRAK